MTRNALMMILATIAALVICQGNATAQETIRRHPNDTLPLTDDPDHGEIAACGSPAINKRHVEDESTDLPALEATGVEGGLVVHLGCGDPPAGGLTAALHRNDSYLVHGLDTDATQVAKAREFIRSEGLYGPVSVATYDGQRLPYVDNLVNMTT